MKFRIYVRVDLKFGDEDGPRTSEQSVAFGEIPEESREAMVGLAQYIHGGLVGHAKLGLEGGKIAAMQAWDLDTEGFQIG